MVYAEQYASVDMIEGTIAHQSDVAGKWQVNALCDVHVLEQFVVPLLL